MLKLIATNLDLIWDIFAKFVNGSPESQVATTIVGLVWVKLLQPLYAAVTRALKRSRRTSRNAQKPNWREAAWWYSGGNEQVGWFIAFVAIGLVWLMAPIGNAKDAVFAILVSMLITFLAAVVAHVPFDSIAAKVIEGIKSKDVPVERRNSNRLLCGLIVIGAGVFGLVVTFGRSNPVSLFVRYYMLLVLPLTLAAGLYPLFKSKRRSRRLPS